MSAPQAFKAGVDLDHVHAALRTRWPDFKAGHVPLHVRRELLLVPPGSVMDRLQAAGDDCHPDSGHYDHFGSVLFGLGCLAAEKLAAEKNVALNSMDPIQLKRAYTTNRV
jgi:hypothetical protein